MFEWFWSEWFWLKPGLTWKDLDPEEEIADLTHYSDLYVYPWLCVLVIFIVRNFILIPFVFTPIGNYFNIRSKPYKHPIANKSMEKLYSVNRARPPRPLLLQYAEELGWEERKVERWLRQKALSQQMTTMDKFNDFGYQLVYYSFSFFGGLWAISRQDYFWDVTKCFDVYPTSSLPIEIKVLSIFTLGFYILQSILLFIHSKRHDFHLMLAHHIFAVIILTSSYIAKLSRIVSLSIVLHDVIDVIMSLGKLFNYCQYTNVSSFLSIIFFFVWFSTRLIMYPVFIMWPCLYIGPQILGAHFPMTIFLNVFNFLLLFVHLSWSAQMIPVIKHKLKNTEPASDPRSSPEEMSEDEVSRNVKKDI